MSRWESIVSLAREIDRAFANGSAPEPALVLELARSVREFQQHLADTRVLIKARLHQPAAPSDAAAE